MSERLVVPESSRSQRGWWIAGWIALAFLQPLALLAKRDDDYVAPPYWHRLLASLFTLGIPTVILAGAIFLVQLWLAGPFDRERVLRFLRNIALLLLVAAAYAALDDLNDEGCNPACSGVGFLVLILPVGFWSLRRPIFPESLAKLAGCLGWLVLIFFLWTALDAWQRYAFGHLNLPASW